MTRRDKVVGNPDPLVSAGVVAQPTRLLRSQVTDPSYHKSGYHGKIG